MNQEYLLADTVTQTLESQCAQAVRHTSNENLEDAGAILSEWTLSNNDCVLTNFLNETTHELTEHLIYISITDKELIEGTFSFDPEAELPTDNI